MLFDAGTKCESASEWPSVYEPAALDAVELVGDRRPGVRPMLARGWEDARNPTATAMAVSPLSVTALSVRVLSADRCRTQSRRCRQLPTTAAPPPRKVLRLNGRRPAPFEDAWAET